MSDASLPELPFTSVKFRRSYEMDPVDELLERIAYALKHNAGIELQALHNTLLTIELPTTKWREGYLMEEVDAHLDEEHRRIGQALGIQPANPASLSDFPLADVFRKYQQD